MKRTLYIILGIAFILTLSACSSNDSAESSVNTETESTAVSNVTTENSNPYEAFQNEASALAESSDANASSEDDTAVSTVKNEYDSVYLQWKYSNWESASDADRRKCAEAYLGYYGDVLGWKVSDEDKSDEQLKKIEESLSGALKKNPDFSVQEIVVYILSEDASSSSSETE